ncbi:pro-neuregulin-1, membrane-bound isoform isoform X2 [Patella vulgata]|uniref:pro-neuregulin-1, membrane-bound isoform isoform X2 n=1 Tax=Patella vulgata TaxID=6465 RepID=UPI00217FC928|nr:pro-neuregulin-1, membrane-bound isoform isoform X2 [Patella vulgata]
MGWCRYRLLVLGLLLLIVHMNCDSCGTKFDDVQSSAIFADVIFEGTLSGKKQPVDSSNRYNITVKVHKIHKGKTFLMTAESKKRRRYVELGVFGPEDKYLCITEIEEKVKYLFFTRNTSSERYFEVSALPIKQSKKSSRAVRKILCKRCAKQPKIKTIKDQKKKEGGKVKFRCSVKAKPRVIKYTWYKDGVELKRRKGLTMKSGKKSSSLQIRNLKKSDAGQYKCIASNAVGEDEKFVRLEVKPKQMEHLLCDIQTYCLNGGTCRYIPTLNNTTFCECPKDFIGPRCEERAPDAVEDFGQAKILHDRTLIIVGIGISILFFVIICIISYFLSKRQRKKWEKRQRLRSSKKNIPDSSVPLLDDVDSNLPRQPPRAFPPNMRPTIHKNTQTGNSLAQIYPCIETHNETSLIETPVTNSIEKVQAIPLNNIPPSNRSRAARGSRSRLKAVSLDEAPENEAKRSSKNQPTRSRSEPDSTWSKGLEFSGSTPTDREANITMQNPPLFSVPKEADMSLDEIDYPMELAEEDADTNYADQTPGVIDVHVMNDFPDEVPSPITDRNPLLQSDSDSDTEDDQSPLPVLYISEEDVRTSLDDLQNLEADSDNVNDTLSDQEFLYTSDSNRFMNGTDSDVGSRASNSSESATSSSAASVRSPSYIMYNSYQDPNVATRSWDEQGMPVADHFAYNSIPGSDSNVIEDQFMHKPPVSPSKTDNKYNVYKKLKDIRDDQDAIPI